MAGDSFASLRERLLRAGIAPRHVRRYLRELTDHLADLTERQRAAGYDEENAAIRARALLGDDAELAVAMEEQPGFRSIAARFPWLVFGIAPAFLATLAYVLTALLIVATAWVGGLLDGGGGLATAPFWFQLYGLAVAQTATFLLPLLVASLLIMLATRQRMPLLWPLLGIAMIVTCGLRMNANMVQPGQHGFSIGLGTTILPLPHVLGGAGFHFEGLIVLAQGVLALLPLAWLLWTRRKAAGAL